MNIHQIFCAVLILALTSLSVHAQENYRWDTVAMGGGGYVSGLIPNPTEPGLVYARTDVGGAYRWDENNQRWIPLTDWVSEQQTGFLSIESLATDPVDPSRLYMLAGREYLNNGKSAVLRSTDRGQTFDVIEVTGQFSVHGNGMGRQNGEMLQVDPNANHILYTGTRDSGLFKSTDFGSSWQRLGGLDVTTTPNESGIAFVLLDPSQSVGGETQRILVGVSRYPAVGPNLYLSEDAGETFSPLSGGPGGLMPQRGLLTSNGQLFIGYGNGAGPHGHHIASLNEPFDQGGLWRYTLSTGTWADVTPEGNSPFGGISVDPEDPNRLIASSTNRWWPQGDAFGDQFYLTEDEGESWTNFVASGFIKDNLGIEWINGKSIHWASSIQFDPHQPNRVWVNSGNGIFRNDDITQSDTWQFTVKGVEETVPLGLVSIPDGPLVSVIGDFDGFTHQDITEFGSIHAPEIGTTTGLAVAAQNTQMMVRVGNDMLFSTDQGQTWTQVASMNGTQGQVALSSDGEVLLHSPANSSTSYRSTDWGDSWTAVTGLSIDNARPVADPVNPSKFYAYDGTDIWVSEDGGQSFVQAGSPGTGGSSLIRAAPACEGNLWVAMGTNGLARSADGGTGFETLNTVEEADALGFGKGAPDADYPAIYIWGNVNGVNGVHRSTDVGASWVRVNNDAREYGGPGNGQFVLGDRNYFGRVYLSTVGRGIAFGEPVVNEDPNPGSSDGGDYNCLTPAGSGDEMEEPPEEEESPPPEEDDPVDEPPVSDEIPGGSASGGGSGGGSVGSEWLWLLLVLVIRTKRPVFLNELF